MMKFSLASLSVSQAVNSPLAAGRYFYLSYSSPHSASLSRLLLRSAAVVTTDVILNVIQFLVDVFSNIRINTESLAEKMWGIRR